MFNLSERKSQAHSSSNTLHDTENWLAKVQEHIVI